jgi:hypothetical protein
MTWGRGNHNLSHNLHEYIIPVYQEFYTSIVYIDNEGHHIRFSYKSFKHVLLERKNFLLVSANHKQEFPIEGMLFAGST